jgi:hypothetical protein
MFALSRASLARSRSLGNREGHLANLAELQEQRGNEGNHEAKHRFVIGLIKNVRKCCLLMNCFARHKGTKNRASRTSRRLTAAACVYRSRRPFAVEVFGFLVLAERFSVFGPFR